MPLLARVAVRSVERLSPSFVRLELGGDDLADFGVDGPFYDQRIKLLFPGPSGRLPELRIESWWEDFLALPEPDRGAIRTYTVAGVRGEGIETTMLVDFVLHPGAHGPGSAWAAEAGVGDELLTVVPKRGEHFGGIEFEPGDARRIMLVGDETALPAIAQIVRELPASVTGSVFIEVPCAEDVQPLEAPPMMEIFWLPRDGRPVGAPVAEAVGSFLGFAPTPAPEDDVDPDVWETPTYSSSGELLPPGDVAPAGDGRYAWIAGESGMVTTLRRHLVNDLGLPRNQVAFMGYWREGVAMRG